MLNNCFITLVQSRYRNPGFEVINKGISEDKSVESFDAEVADFQL